MTLAIRDPEDFYASASPSSDPSTSSSSSSSRQKRLPSLEELRLFTAGSDSGDLIERCLFTGAILVSFRVVSAARIATYVSICSLQSIPLPPIILFISANHSSPIWTYLVLVPVAHPHPPRHLNLRTPYPPSLPLLLFPRTQHRHFSLIRRRWSGRPNGSTSRSSPYLGDRLGCTCPSTRRKPGQDDRR